MNAASDPVAACERLIKDLREGAGGLSERVLADRIIEGLAAARLLWPDEALTTDGPVLPALSVAARIASCVAGLSGSAALIYAMHMSQALTLERHGADSPFLSSILTQFRDRQVLVASATSEKGVGGDIFGTLCTIEVLSTNEHSLTKESPNISYLGQAEGALVTAILVNEKGRREQVILLALKDDLKITPGKPTEFLGMKGIDNRPYTLHVRVRPEAILRDRFPVVARRTMTPVIHILWAALWSGLAHHAIEKGNRFVASLADSELTLKPVLRYQMSALIDKHFTLNSLIREALHEFDTPRDAIADGMNWAANIKRLKTVCSNLATEICLGVLEVVGMPGYAETGALSLGSVLRDVLSSKVMISNFRLVDSNASAERYLKQII